VKTFLHWLLRLLYGLEAHNVSALDTPGPVLLLSNHVSWWDWLLLGVWLADDWRFVTSSTTAKVSSLHRRIMINRRTFPVDMNSPYALKRVAEYLQKGGRLVLFPEGRLSRTGSLMKLFEGTGFLIHKTQAKVITAYIRNAQRLPLSPNPGLKKWFPRISIHFSTALARPEQQHEQHVKPAEARSRLMEALQDQMTTQQFETEMAFGPATLPEAIMETARQHPGRVVLQDATMQQLSYGRLLAGAELLAKQWRRLPVAAHQRVGVLLPNVNAMPAAILSLWAADRIPAILNYSSGAATILTCARLAELKHIITSGTFVERLKLDLAPFKSAGIEIVFLEDARAAISPPQKVISGLRTFLDLRSRKCPSRATDTAVLLFTSGSEGNPKGVELTHRNLLANIRQMLSVTDLMDSDRFFNALPLFHSFGLTIGLLLPLVRGVFIFLYLSPLHYRVVPAAFYNLDCTVLFGTNTFLAGYGRKAHPYDFHALRYLFVGAEKVQESTTTLWMRKFGVRVLEGYGATECSPCLSANLPMNPRHGSAGQFLPGIEYRLDPVEGVADESGRVGRLFVRGPNIMRGYVNPEANAYFQALEGWYDTGDIVKVDADGFVFILGRLKRFAKISGEMVSLTAVEDALAGAFPQYGAKFAIAVIAKADEAKGEKLVAITNEPKLTLEEVRETIRARGLGNLALPREIKTVRELPYLGSGKVDHRELEKMV